MIQLVNENCFDWLTKQKNQSVELVLIDPPYAISDIIKRDYSREKGLQINKYFGDWDNSFTLDNLNTVINQCYRILKNSGTLICFYDIWKLSYLKQILTKNQFVQIKFIEWVKTNPPPINSSCGYLPNARQIALVGIKGGKSTFNSKYDNGIYNFGLCSDSGRFHPTQKPIQLIKTLIEKHSNKGDTVLDCFSGSGTTAVACYQTDRNFVGCELNKQYYDKTIQRFYDCGILTRKNILW